MAHYEVTHQRNVGDQALRVIATTRRYNGAINERDVLVESAAHVARKHAGRDRVVVGPTGGPDAVAVVTILSDGLLVETYAVRRKEQP